MKFWTREAYTVEFHKYMVAYPVRYRLQLVWNKTDTRILQSLLLISSSCSQLLMNELLTDANKLVNPLKSFLDGWRRTFSISDKNKPKKSEKAWLVKIAANAYFAGSLPEGEGALRTFSSLRSRLINPQPPPIFLLSKTLQ